MRRKQEVAVAYNSKGQWVNIRLMQHGHCLEVSGNGLPRLNIQLKEFEWMLTATLVQSGLRMYNATTKSDFECNFF